MYQSVSNCVDAKRINFVIAQCFSDEQFIMLHFLIVFVCSTVYLFKTKSCHSTLKLKIRYYVNPEFGYDINEN